MANRCFKIPQVVVQRGFWNPAAIFSHSVSLALGLKERVIKRSGEASASADAQESLSQVKRQVELSTRLPETGHGDDLLEMAVEFHSSFPILIEVRPG